MSNSIRNAQPATASKEIAAANIESDFESARLRPMRRTACSSFSLGGVSNDVIGRPEGYCICEVKTISPMFRPFESARELYTPDVFVTPMKSSPRVDFRGLRVTEKSLGHAKTQVDSWNLSHHGSCPLATAPGALRISAGHFYLHWKSQ